MALAVSVFPSSHAIPDVSMDVLLQIKDPSQGLLQGLVWLQRRPGSVGVEGGGALHTMQRLRNFRRGCGRG